MHHGHTNAYCSHIMVSSPHLFSTLKDEPERAKVEQMMPLVIWVLNVTFAIESDFVRKELKMMHLLNLQSIFA